MKKYFYINGADKIGPFSFEQLKNENISRETKVWYYGLDNWKNLSDIEELNSLCKSIPPPLNVIEVVEKSIQIKSGENQKNYKPSATNHKKKHFGKWLIGTVAALFISFLVYSSISSQSDVKFYNEIAANSYESDENFEMYVEKFYRDLEFYGIYPKKPKTTTIRLSRLDQLDNATHIHGLSFGVDDDDKIEIYINPSTWKSFNKPMRYFLMYHELAHDILNVDDLDATSINEGKLMYPIISSYENKNMDDFIESTHELFEELLTE